MNLTALRFNVEAIEKHHGLIEAYNNVYNLKQKLGQVQRELTAAAEKFEVLHHQAIAHADSGPELDRIFLDKLTELNSELRVLINRSSLKNIMEEPSEEKVLIKSFVNQSDR